MGGVLVCGEKRVRSHPRCVHPPHAPSSLSHPSTTTLPPITRQTPPATPPPALRRPAPPRVAPRRSGPRRQARTTRVPTNPPADQHTRTLAHRVPSFRLHPGSRLGSKAASPPSTLHTRHSCFHRPQVLSWVGARVGLQLQSAINLQSICNHFDNTGALMGRRTCRPSASICNQSAINLQSF